MEGQDRQGGLFADERRLDMEVKLSSYEIELDMEEIPAFERGSARVVKMSSNERGLARELLLREAAQGRVVFC